MNLDIYAKTKNQEQWKTIAQKNLETDNEKKNTHNSVFTFDYGGDDEEVYERLMKFIKFRFHPKNKKLVAFSYKKGGGTSPGFQSKRKLVKHVYKTYSKETHLYVAMYKWPIDTIKPK
jgi:hypothetical protein